MKWVRWQGKYDPEGISTEIDTLKMRIPSFPGYLEVARFFDYQSQTDRSFLPSAKKCYEKAERESMLPQDFLNFSLVCYQVGDVQKLSSDFELGVQVAKDGLVKHPNYSALTRALLWNQMGLASVVNSRNYPDLTSRQLRSMEDSIYKEALVTADNFIETADTLTKLYPDYKWISTVKYQNKQYEEAIKYCKLGLSMDAVSNRDKESAYGLLVDCYAQLNDASSAQAAFRDYEKQKIANERPMEAYDYNRLLQAYLGVYSDTLLSTETRNSALASADSLVLIAAESGNDYKARFYNEHFNYVSVLYPPIDDKPQKEVMDAAKLLETKAQELVDDPELKDNYATNYFYLMIAKYNIMVWYYYSAMYLEAFNMSEYILYDMKESFELEGLSSGRLKDYTTYKNNANIINKNSKGKR